MTSLYHDALPEQDDRDLCSCDTPGEPCAACVASFMADLDDQGGWPEEQQPPEIEAELDAAWDGEDGTWELGPQPWPTDPLTVAEAIVAFYAAKAQRRAVRLARNAVEV